MSITIPTTNPITLPLRGNVGKCFDGSFTVLTVGPDQAKALYEQLHGLKQIFDPEPCSNWPGSLASGQREDAPAS